MSQKIEAVVQFNTHNPRASITRPANTTAYTAGDVVSDATADAHFTFENASRAGTQNKQLGGSIPTARIWSSANQATKLEGELWLFHTDIVAVADNAAFAPTDVEMLTLVGVVDFPAANWKAGAAGIGAAGNAVCEAYNLGFAFKSSEKKLYGQLVVRNAYTPVSGEIFTAEIVVSRD